MHSNDNLCLREGSVVENQELNQIFIKHIHDIVLKFSFVSINFQKWNSGSHWNLWQDIKYSFTWLTGMKKSDFSCYQLFDSWHMKKIKKWHEPKKKFVSKNSFFMPVNHANELLKYSLYFHNFFCILIAGINVPKLVEELLRTCIFLIWVRLLDFQKTGLV